MDGPPRKGAFPRLATWAALLLACVLLLDPAGDAEHGPLSTGMLPPGVYPVASIAHGESSSYRRAGDPTPSLTVTPSKGGQTQRYRVDGLDVAFDVVALDGGPATGLRRLTIAGLSFSAPQPVAWREADESGVVAPGRPWRWTLRWSDGDITLTHTAVAHPPEVEGGDTVQRIDATLTFAGDAEGKVELRQWEEVGNAARSRKELSGAVTVLGSTIQFDVVLVVGGLGAFPGIG